MLRLNGSTIPDLRQRVLLFLPQSAVLQRDHHVRGVRLAGDVLVWSRRKIPDQKPVWLFWFLLSVYWPVFDVQLSKPWKQLLETIVDRTRSHWSAPIHLLSSLEVQQINKINIEIRREMLWAFYAHTWASLGSIHRTRHTHLLWEEALGISLQSQKRQLQLAAPGIKYLVKWPLSEGHIVDHNLKAKKKRWIGPRIYYKRLSSLFKKSF